jgi:hypothetical protein
MSDTKKRLAKQLDKFIKAKRSQDECVGFIAGFEDASEYQQQTIDNLTKDSGKHLLKENTKLKEQLKTNKFPTDSDIKKHIDSLPYYATEYNEGFEDGVKWIKQLLTKQQ